MIFQDDRPYVVLGTMGGDGQPQTHLQVISNIVDFSLDTQEAIEAPRWPSPSAPARAALAGIEQPLTPHSLRPTFATRALEVTEDLAVVQDLLGHASPATTRVYARVSSRRLRQAHREIFGYEGRGRGLGLDVGHTAGQHPKLGARLIDATGGPLAALAAGDNAPPIASPRTETACQASNGGRPGKLLLPRPTPGWDPQGGRGSLGHPPV